MKGIKNVIFINPKTGKKCDFKKCEKKFTIDGRIKKIWHPRIDGVITDVEFYSYYRECSECGRRIFHLPKEKRKSKASYMYRAYGLFDYNDMDETELKELGLEDN